MSSQNMHGVWSSRWTFVMAATGSAVGLGNIWKFPYITGENGGGAFVLVYLLCIALIGIPIMLAEVLLGRRGRQSPINAMRFVTKEAGLHGAWTGIGWMGVLAGLFIMSFYSVVAGWAINYVVEMLSGTFSSATADTAGAQFEALLANPAQIIMWHSVFSVMTAVVVITGVTRGLAMVARVLMPLLMFMLIALLIYGFVNGDIGRAATFLFSPKFDQLSWSAVLVAMGHAFFTLSLGMGAIMAYGAYMPKHAPVAQTVLTVGALDTVIALVAGMAIFPIVFGNGLEASSGPGLMFVSLPIAFGNMPAGLLFGALFFVLVTIAAWSSAVSLIEPGVAWLVETRKFDRLKATLVLAGGAWLLGLSAALSFNILSDFKPWFLVNRTPFDFLDFITAQIMLPLGGLFIAVFVGWRMSKSIIREEMDVENHALLNLWLFVLKYVAPLLVAIVFVTSLADALM